MRVFVGTYNAAASPPPAASAAVWRDWLRLDPLAYRDAGLAPGNVAPRLQPGAADVYCLGLQEIVHLNAVNILTSDTRTDERVEEWEARVGAVLGEKSIAARTNVVAVTDCMVLNLTMSDFISALELFPHTRQVSSRCIVGVQWVRSQARYSQ